MEMCSLSKYIISVLYFTFTQGKHLTASLWHENRASLVSHSGAIVSKISVTGTHHCDSATVNPVTKTATE